MEKAQESENNYNLLIAKKTEKIVTAIYLVSQFLPKEESIKNELRKEANILLKDMMSLAFFDEEKGQIFSLYRKCLNTTSLIISNLFVAKSSGLISSMNVDIVVEALRMLETILSRKQFYLRREDLFINEEKTLENIISNRYLSQKENLNFNTSLDVLSERNINLPFSATRKIKEEVGNTFSVDSGYFKSEESNLVVKNPTQIKINHKGQNIIKDKTKDIKEENIKKGPLLKLDKLQKNKNRKDNRRLQILALFTKGVEVSINDISKKIVGCSVKTLQRELNDLVLEKKINKVGEKRWSRYTLA